MRLVVPKAADGKVKGVIGKWEKFFIGHNPMGGDSGRGCPWRELCGTTIVAMNMKYPLLDTALTTAFSAISH